MHSLAGNHALVDGNKRLALLATVVFLRINGYVLDLTDDEAFELTMSCGRRTAGRRGNLRAASARESALVTHDACVLRRANAALSFCPDRTERRGHG